MGGTPDRAAQRSARASSTCDVTAACRRRRVRYFCIMRLTDAFVGLGHLPRRDLLLCASGTLGLAVAFGHGLLGETHVFARARIEPEHLRRLIRLVWHCSA